MLLELCDLLADFRVLLILLPMVRIHQLRQLLLVFLIPISSGLVSFNVGYVKLVLVQNAFTGLLSFRELWQVRKRFH